MSSPASTIPLDAAAAARDSAQVSAVWWIARKEWLDLRRDNRWRAFVCVTVLLMLAALALGLLRVQRHEREHHAAEAGDRQVWTAQGAKNPHSAAHFGQYAYKPTGALALVEPGVDAHVGSAVYLEAHKQNEEQFRSARDTSLSARMGQLTLSFLLQTMLPLMAILLGFAAFTGEREQGTLRQLLGQGVRPMQLFLGKALTGAGVLLSLLVLTSASVAVILAIALPLLAADHSGNVLSDAGRLLGLSVGYGLYLLGFMALSLAVSANARSSRSALIGLLVFWWLNSFLMPRLMTDIVRSHDPLPTALAFRNTIADDKKQLFGHDESHPGFVAFRDRILKQYQVERVEDLPVSFRGLSLREDDEAGYRIFDRHFGRLQAQLEAQDSRRAVAGYVFPMLALQPLSMALAGTDNRHHHHFVNAAEKHRRLIQNAASQDLIDHAKNGDSSYAAPATTWESIPSFEYQQPGALWATETQWSNFAALGLWCLACWMWAWRSSLRLKA